MKVTLAIVNIVIALIPYVGHAQMPHILKCRGNLPTFCLRKEKGQWKSVSNSLEGFTVRESECLALRSGVDKEKPYVQFVPWAVITHKTFPENFKAGLNVTFDSKGEDSLSITLNGKNSKFVQQLKCSVAVDVK